MEKSDGSYFKLKNVAFFSGIFEISTFLPKTYGSRSETLLKGGLHTLDAPIYMFARNQRWILVNICSRMMVSRLSQIIIIKNRPEFRGEVVYSLRRLWKGVGLFYVFSSKGSVCRRVLHGGLTGSSS